MANSTLVPELLRDVTDHLRLALLDAGQPEPTAEMIAHDFSEHLRQHWGGQAVYFPKAPRLVSHRLHEAVWAEFTGANQSALAKRHGIGVRYVDRIIATMRERERTKTSDLFADPQDPA